MRDQIRWADFVLIVCTRAYYRRFWGEEEPGRGLGATWEGAIITSELYHSAAKSAKFIPLVFDQSDTDHIPEPLNTHTHYLPLVRDGPTGYEGLYAFLTGQPLVERGPIGALRKVASRKASKLFAHGNATAAPAEGSLHGVPALPPHYLARSAPLNDLKRSLLAESSTHVAITGHGQAIGVQGMGGLGKSVLATAVAHDPEVRRAFPDGVVWLSVGQHPKLIELQGELLKALTGEVPALATARECADAIRDALAGRKVLIILDDVWEADHASLFRAIPSGCRLLVTTRNAEVLVGLGAEEHRLDLLSIEESLKVLSEWSGKPLNALPPEAGEIVRECGRLPLALAAVGALVRLGPAGWKDALTRLRRSDLDAFRKAFPEYPYPHLLRALDTSIEALPEEDRVRYEDMAIFPEEVEIPESPVRTLWGLDDLDTRDAMNRLAARSLATVSVGHGDTLVLRLHDLQRDVLRKRGRDRLEGIHARLVECWGDLLDLPDAYAWQWIGWHLVEAKQPERLADLLLNPDWLDRKLWATNINSLLSDTERLSDGPEFRLLADALRLSAHVLAVEKDQLVSQLHGRLLGTTLPRLVALRESLARCRDRDWLRCQWPALTPPGGSLRRTLTGHLNQIAAIELTPDGRRLISASWDSTLKIWDLEQGECLQTLKGHTDRVVAVAITPEGRRLISASVDKMLKVWDIERGECLHTLAGHSHSIVAVAFMPDGRRLISASWDCTLKVWDIERGECLHTFKGHSSGVVAVVLTSDGRRLISASCDGMLKVWDPERGECLHTLHEHSHEVTALAVTPDGRRLFSASADKTLKTWDLEQGKCLDTLRGHAGGVMEVGLTPDSRRLISASDEGTLKIWDFERRECLHTLHGHSDTIIAVALTPDGRKIISASWDGTLKVWDIEQGRCLHTFKGHSDKLVAVAVTPDGRRIISASEDNTLKIWELEQGESFPALDAHTGGVVALGLTPTGRRIISASRDKTLKVWDGRGECLHTLTGHSGDVVAVEFTPDEGRLISASWDHTLRVWDFDSGECLHILHGHSGDVVAVALTPNARRVISASWDNTLKIWDLERGESLHTLRGHSGEVAAVAVTPDGRRIISGSGDYTLKAWDLERGQCLQTLEGHSNLVFAIAIAPDGRRIISASDDNTLKIWDLERGECLHTLEEHVAEITAVALTPDGRRIVSGSDHATLKIWDLDQGKCLHTLDGHAASIVAIVITPDGRRILSASDDLTLKVWNLGSLKLEAEFHAEARIGAIAAAPDSRTFVVGDANGGVYVLRLILTTDPPDR